MRFIELVFVCNAEPKIHSNLVLNHYKIFSSGPSYQPYLINSGIWIIWRDQTTKSLALNDRWGTGQAEEALNYFSGRDLADKYGLCQKIHPFVDIFGGRISNIL